jgi:undecaprenyl pyrophosphate phosphatase UppP
MVEWLVAVVVGVVQGLLEWLPVSSEGAVALALMSVDELETHVERLERDLEDLNRGFDDTE